MSRNKVGVERRFSKLKKQLHLEMCLLNRLATIMSPCFCVEKQGLTDSLRSMKGRREGPNHLSVCPAKEVLTDNVRRKELGEKRGDRMKDTSDRTNKEKRLQCGITLDLFQHHDFGPTKSV